MNRAAFLDRDGVINRKAPPGQYITCWEDMHFLPGVIQGIALLNRVGFRVIVVTNQRCIAKGLVTEAGMTAMHRRMRTELSAAGAVIDDIYYCPHEMHPACTCRKPAPGMLLEAATEHNIDLANSWMIGDTDIDMQAARNAGCKTARLLEADDISNCRADVTAPSLLALVGKILELESSVEISHEPPIPPLVPL